MIPAIDPKVDYAFKRLFGHEQTSALLAGLLDAILQPPPERRLVELTLLNPFNDKEALDDKLSILDIKARDQSGQQYNIEMQLLTHAVFRARALYYWARFHQGQLHEGENYLRLRPTISICLVNTPLFATLPDCHLVFELLERRHHVAFNDHLALHILELGKFTKSAKELVTPLDRWLYFLCHGERLDTEALPPELDQPEIHRALEVLQVMNQSSIERERYEERQKYQHDMATWYAEARQEGREEALPQGVLIGRVQSLEQVMRRPVTDIGQLRQLPLAELERLAVALQAETIRALSQSPPTE